MDVLLTLLQKSPSKQEAGQGEHRLAGSLCCQARVLTRKSCSLLLSVWCYGNHRELTCALLMHDFGLKLELPIDQLCPPVPNRANYIYWLCDLLSENSPDIAHSSIRGIDMCVCKHRLLAKSLFLLHYTAPKRHRCILHLPSTWRQDWRLVFCGHGYR